MKRTHTDAFPLALRRSPRLNKPKEKEEEEEEVLPREMIQEILQWLIPDAMTRCYISIDYNEKRWAIQKVRQTNRLWNEIMLKVVRETWRTAYMKAKRECAEHDWRLPHPTLLYRIVDLKCTMYVFEDIGLSRKYQLGWLNSSLFVPATRDDANAVIDCIRNCYPNRGERAREEWFKTVPANQTMAQLLDFADHHIEYPTWGSIFKVLLPRWVHRDLDDCLVHLLLWMDIHAWAWEEICFFRHAFVALILEHKVKLQNEKCVARIRDRWGALRWEHLTVERALMLHWIYKEPLKDVNSFWTFLETY